MNVVEKMALSVALRSDLDRWCVIPRGGPRVRASRSPQRAMPRSRGGRLRREIQPRIGDAHAGLGQAEFAAHDVGALDQRDAFVIGDAARQALAAKAAI